MRVRADRSIKNIFDIWGKVFATGDIERIIRHIRVHAGFTIRAIISYIIIQYYEWKDSI